MSRPVVVVTLQQFCETDPGPRELLRRAGCEVRENTLGRRMTAQDCREWLKDADAVIAGVEPYDGTLLNSLPRLRCISRCGTGTDAIDLDAARRVGVTILTTPDAVVEAVAQLTLAMILASARNLPLHHSDSHAGRWTKRTGRLVSEWCIGLIGYGRVGQAVGRYLQAFGPTLLITDPQLDGKALPDGVDACPLDALLGRADLVSLHVSRRPEEGVLLGRQELTRMRRGSVLVNTSRGFLIDEQALYDLLVEGRLAGAALDVFATEPYHGPLAQLPQVLCTPHVGSLTVASRAAMEWQCARNVVSWLEGRG
ncbi:MAG: phosphoglycerate dehydrogenase [Candidatus Omnitrophica bacterium]|nr:phosphoglycerate dehydrogenase [Candidatus Omnitrophota bacterium]